jgi:6-phosphogluconolactonase
LPRLPHGQGEESRDVSKDIWAADLHLTPDGKFIYASERTCNTISLLSVDAGSGKLTYLSSTPTERQPRGFAIDPKGKYMVVTGQLSDTISVYAIDSSGELKLLQKCPTGRDSNWVEIVTFG